MHYWFLWVRRAILIILLAGLSAACKPAEKTEPPCSSIVSASMCHKIGQMLIVGFGGYTQNAKGKVLWDDPWYGTFSPKSNIAKDIAQYHVGGVILFSSVYRNSKTHQYIRDRNITSPKQLKALIVDLQQYNQSTRQAANLPDLPLLISIDQEGGLVRRLTAEFGFSIPKIIPQALGLNQAIARDTTERQAALNFSYQIGKNTAKTLQQNGINLNFAPLADVNVNPINPIIGAFGRSFSGDPTIVTDQARQWIEAHHSENVLTSLKHFPGHGSSTKDSHLGMVDVTDVYHKETELMPYKILIDQGYQDFIMSTHVINGQFDKTQCRAGQADNHATWCPGTMSYKVLTELLRNQLGFKGIIVSDDMTMYAINRNYPLDVALEKSINAGANMFLIGNHQADDTPRVINTIARLVKQGKVNASLIEQSYQRIVKLKQRLKNERVKSGSSR